MGKDNFSFLIFASNCFFQETIRKHNLTIQMYFILAKIYKKQDEHELRLTASCFPIQLS